MGGGKNLCFLNHLPFESCHVITEELGTEISKLSLRSHKIHEFKSSGLSELTALYKEWRFLQRIARRSAMEKALWGSKSLPLSIFAGHENGSKSSKENSKRSCKSKTRERENARLSGDFRMHSMEAKASGNQAAIEEEGELKALVKLWAK